MSISQYLVLLKFENVVAANILGQVAFSADCCYEGHDEVMQSLVSLNRGHVQTQLIEGCVGWRGVAVNYDSFLGKKIQFSWLKDTFKWLAFVNLQQNQIESFFANEKNMNAHEIFLNKQIRILLLTVQVATVANIYFEY